MPTDRRYTGQREVADLDLYNYAARYYDPYIGRFIQADTIIPDPGSAQSYNRYSYVLNNPLRYIDPTGHVKNDTTEIQRAQEILDILTNDYDVTINKDWKLKGLPWAKKWNAGSWTIDELETILSAVTKLANVMGGAENFRSELGGVKIHRLNMPNNCGLGGAHHVYLSKTNWTYTNAWGVVHELGHAWDWAHGAQLSKDMQTAMGAGFTYPIKHFFDKDNDTYWYNVGSGPPPCGIDGNFNRFEDFAEAVAASAYPEKAQQRAIDSKWPYTNDSPEYTDFYATPRGQHMQALMTSLP